MKEKRIEAQRAKPCTPTPAIDALIGDEEQKEKRREQRKKQGVGTQPSYPGPFGRLLRTAGIMRCVYSCNPHGPQGERVRKILAT